MAHLLACSAFVGTSLDGFIARPDGALDFLHTGGTEDHGFTAFLRSVDVIVMGRHTWETVLGFGKWPYGKTPVVVLSTGQVRAPGAPEAVWEQMAGTPGEVADRLAARGFRHAYVDGGVTIQRFLEAGLLGRLVVTRVPVLIGRGIPLFGAVARDVPLRHVATRAYPTGLVQSEYTITG